MAETVSKRTRAGELTRRRLVQAGAAGAATVWLGKLGRLGGVAAAADDSPPLRRSTYLGLSSPSFAVTSSTGASSLELLGVEDLPAAGAVPSLRGNDDAFLLRFGGPQGALGQDIHQLSHPEIGNFQLFLVPSGRGAGGGEYAAVIDRTVKLPASGGGGAASSAGPEQQAKPAVADAPARPSTAVAPRLLKASLRRSRSGRALVAEVRLSPGAEVEKVRATLLRRGKVFARADAGSHHGRSMLRFGVRPPSRRAAYVLALVLVDRNGHVSTLRRRVRLP